MQQVMSFRCGHDDLNLGDGHVRGDTLVRVVAEDTYVFLLWIM
jgi:hypothetical protein